MNKFEQLVLLAEQRGDVQLAQMLGEHLFELKEVFGWMVETTRDKFNAEFGHGDYSIELQRAMEHLGIE